MRRNRGLTLVLLLTGTCMFAGVTVKYDHSVDFTRYRTYSWIAARQQDPDWNERMSNAVDGQLKAKGWCRVESGGDASVAAERTRSGELAIEIFDTNSNKPIWGGTSNDENLTKTVADILKQLPPAPNPRFRFKLVKGETFH